MCGIVGYVSRYDDAANPLRWGAQKLQHRAHRSVGAGTYDASTGEYYSVRGIKELPDVLDSDALEFLKGRIGIAHLRWATAGSLKEENVHPLEGRFRSKRFFLVHNGEISYRKQLEGRFSGYQLDVDSDSKYFAALIEYSRAETFEGALREALEAVQGTYSLLVLFEDSLYAARDPSGNRPFFVGIKDDAVCFVSEDLAFRVMGFDPAKAREVEPGEIIRVRGRDLHMRSWQLPGKNGVAKRCMIEALYSMHPSSTLAGRTIQKIREAAGRQLAKQYRPEADIVVGIPDSGVDAGQGFAAGSGISYKQALTRYHQSGRIFYGGLEERPDKYRFKFDPIVEELKGRSVVLVDDTLFEGATIQHVIEICMDAGVREVHVAIPAPMITAPCYYGTPTSSEHRRLIARDCDGDNARILEEISGPFNGFVRSLAFLDLEKAKQAIADTEPFREQAAPITAENFCDACFLGGRPHIPVDVE